MRIAIGSDHAGFELKQHLATLVAAAGHAVTDLGAHSEEPVDYPDFAAAVGRAVVEGRADRGIIVCGSGAGAAVAANKVKGVRCTPAHDTYTAHQAVEHDDVNVLVMGSRIVGIELARELVGAYLNAQYTAEERHVRRLGKVLDIEKRYCQSP